MNILIKKRITAINNGIIPEGYKKTKVGIVPVEWEENRIENICKMKSGNTITAKQFDDLGKYPCYGGNGLRGFTNSFTHNGKYVLIGRQGALCGNVKLVSGHFFASEHAIVVTNTKSNCDYTYQLFNYMNLNRYSESSAQPGLSVEKVLRLKIAVPPLPEQQKIAEILGAQDKLIELQERKINKLKTLKKGYLQKMFPKKGCKYPELRFKGFTDAWEQRELGEYIIEHTEVTTHNNQYPVLTSSRKGIFLQSDYYNKQIASEDNTGYNIVPYGYFTYRHMSDDEIFYFNINDIVENGIVSTLYPVFTTTKDLDSRYLQYQLNYGSEFSNFAILQKQGGSRTYMYLSKLKKLKLTKPVSIEEQKQISDYFRTLDNLITLHQRKLDEEKQKKKALMQLLLTGKVRVKL